MLPFPPRTNEGAIILAPGIGLTKSYDDRGSRATTEVLLFEHTAMGTGGLVFNCPTPLRLKDIPVDRYKNFAHLPLMLGSGLLDDTAENESTLPLSDLAPWFWLHNLPDIPGSSELMAASGPLFMGGDLEKASEYLLSNDIDPAGRLQFFRKYKSWGPGELIGEIQAGLWTHVGPQSPQSALRIFF